MTAWFFCLPFLNVARFLRLQFLEAHLEDTKEDPQTQVSKCWHQKWASLCRPILVNQQLAPSTKVSVFVFN